MLAVFVSDHVDVEVDSCYPTPTVIFVEFSECPTKLQSLRQPFPLAGRKTLSGVIDFYFFSTNLPLVAQVLVISNPRLF